MIFTGKLFDQIAAGEKTVTRRPCVSKAGRRFNPPLVGDTLPIQRGYAKPTLWVRVVSVERQDAFLPDFQDNEEARREGFHAGVRSGEAFWLEWRAIYDDDPVDVYRIEFEPPTPAEAT